MTSVFRNLSINFETCFFAPFKSKLKDISIYSIYFELLDYLQWILALLCVQFPPFHPANNKYGTFYRGLTKNPAYVVTSNFTRSVIPRWAGYPSSRTYFMPTQNIDPIFTCTWLFFNWVLCMYTLVPSGPGSPSGPSGPRGPYVKATWSTPLNISKKWMSSTEIY